MEGVGPLGVSGGCRVKSKVQDRERDMPPFVLNMFFIHLKTRP